MRTGTESGTMAVHGPPRVFAQYHRLAFSRRVRPEFIIERALLFDETVREQTQEGRRVVLTDEYGHVLEAVEDAEDADECTDDWQVLPVPVTPRAAELLVQMMEVRGKTLGHVLVRALRIFDRGCAACRDGGYVLILNPRGDLYGGIHPFRQT